MANICKKKGHNLEYQFINWVNDKQQFLQCLRCVLEDEGPNFQKILISDILDEKQQLQNINNWPPFQDKELIIFINQIFQSQEQNPEQKNLLAFFVFNQIEQFFLEQERLVCQKLNQMKKNVKVKFEKYIEKFQAKNNGDLFQILGNLKIENLREKLRQFYENKIDIEQFFEFKQEQDQSIVQIQEGLAKVQFEQQQDIQQQFLRLKEEIEKNIQIIINYQFQLPENIQLKFYKSQYQNVQDSIYISENCDKISFLDNNCGSYKQVYTDNLEKEKNYHIKLRIDTKGTIKKQYFNFGIGSYEQKDQQINNNNFIQAFYKDGEIQGSNKFLKLGKYDKFIDFFEDIETVLNIAININKNQFEIYDDKKQLKCSIQIQDVKQPVFFIWCYQYNVQQQDDFYIESVESY